MSHPHRVRVSTSTHIDAIMVVHGSLHRALKFQGRDSEEGPVAIIFCAGHANECQKALVLTEINMDRNRKIDRQCDSSVEPYLAVHQYIKDGIRRFGALHVIVDAAHRREALNAASGQVLADGIEVKGGPEVGMQEEDGVGYCTIVLSIQCQDPMW